MNSMTFKKDLIGVQNDLLRFAYKLTSDREEANDLLQETSLKALDNEDKYMPDTNFKGWIYTIMRNIFINNYRKVVRDQTFVDQTDNLYHLNLPRDTAFENTESALQGSPAKRRQQGIMKGEGDTDKHRFIQKRTICSGQTHHIFPLNR